MPIIGTQITRIHAERINEKSTGQINIKSNAELKDIVKNDIVVGGEKRTTMQILFNFTINYDKLAKIEVEGAMVYAADKKVLDKILKEWKKNKKLPESDTVGIMNNILEVSYMQAIPLANSLQLPPPVRFPRVTAPPKE